MNILLCIDDTDDIEKGQSTGMLCQGILSMVEARGWGICKKISRHQLLVHEDIPYTSHNSSMCFSAVIDDDRLQDIIDIASEYLRIQHAPGSDPGLCVVNTDVLQNKQRLIDFGFSAKRIVLHKEDAYQRASDLQVHLSEHGGTGLGVIGALAGAGLRLSGEDGEFKGRANVGEEGEIKTAGELRSCKNVDDVCGIDRLPVGDAVTVQIGANTKTVLMEGKSVLLVGPCEDGTAELRSCSKHELRKFDEMRCQSR